MTATQIATVLLPPVCTLVIGRPWNFTMASLNP